MINSKANSKAVEVTIVAREVSTGITKLSGSRPLLNVKMETPKDKSVIKTTAIMFESQIIKIKLTAIDIENTWLITREIKAKTVKIIREDPQALKMFLA
jgi:hypothetical protein